MYVRACVRMYVFTYVYMYARLHACCIQTCVWHSCTNVCVCACLLCPLAYIYIKFRPFECTSSLCFVHWYVTVLAKFSKSLPKTGISYRQQTVHCYFKEHVPYGIRNKKKITNKVMYVKWQYVQVFKKIWYESTARYFFNPHRSIISRSTIHVTSEYTEPWILSGSIQRLSVSSLVARRSLILLLQSKSDLYPPSKSQSLYVMTINSSKLVNENEYSLPWSNST